MSKILSGLLLAGLIGASAQADVVRVEMGAGAWQNELSGTITSGTPAVTEDFSALNYEEETKGYAWVYIKHPVPILPNLRLEYAAVDFAGTSTQSFDYKGSTYQANAKSDLTLDQFDIIMYYNILDNTAWMTLDLGLDVKVVQAEFNAVGLEDITNNPLSFNEKETLPLPMGYARARVEIPGTDIGLEGNVKYMAYKESKVMDYAIKADYTLVDILPVDVGLEVGYRFQQFDIDGTDFDIDTSLDVEIDGVFVGATVKF
jgi:outer membrane protein